MPRPRKDGQPPRPAKFVGKRRTTAGGKGWNVRAYESTPTNGARIDYIPPGEERKTSRKVKDHEDLFDLFRQFERMADRQIAPPRETTRDGVRRDMTALGRLYLDHLRALGRSDGYIANRSCIINRWIVPTIGSVLVTDWSTEHSLAVFNAAIGNVGPSRVNDIRSTLSGMRAAAHRKRPGGRWLDPAEDPLEDTSFGTGAPKTTGQDRRYVPVHLRPSEEAVKAAIRAAGNVRTFVWMPRIIQVASFEAARLGEQLGLRAIDVDFDFRNLDINGSWAVARKAEDQAAPRRRYRKETKNRTRRSTPFAESRRADLLVDCRRALGLPEDTSEADVVAAIQSERARRALLTRSGDWRDYEEDPAKEPWLFPDESGVPPTKERFNAEWRKVRDAAGWAVRIPYKNLRHHAIQRWHRLLGLDYEDIAPWSGHDYRTLEAYYRIPSQDAASRARSVLDKM